MSTIEKQGNTLKLNNVSIEWLRADRTAPGFYHKWNPEDNPSYSVKITTDDKKVSKEWEDAGLNVQKKEENGKAVYKASLKQKVYRTDPATRELVENPPVLVVDGMRREYEDTSIIGNGSTANILLRGYTVKSTGYSGFALQAIQIVRLKEYHPDASFDSIGETVVEVQEMEMDDGDFV